MTQLLLPTHPKFVVEITRSKWTCCPRFNGLSPHSRNPCCSLNHVYHGQKHGICGMVIPASLEIPKELSGYNIWSPILIGSWPSLLSCMAKYSKPMFWPCEWCATPSVIPEKNILVGQLWILLMDWDNPQYPHLILGSMAPYKYQRFWALLMWNPRLSLPPTSTQGSDEGLLRELASLAEAEFRTMKRNGIFWVYQVPYRSQ